MTGGRTIKYRINDSIGEMVTVHTAEKSVSNPSIFFFFLKEKKTKEKEKKRKEKKRKERKKKGKRK
jgi:hypothetical protein